MRQFTRIYQTLSIQKIIKFVEDDIESNKKDLQKIALFLSIAICLFTYFSYNNGFLVLGCIFFTTLLIVDSINYFENLMVNLTKDIKKTIKWFWLILPFVYMGLFIYRQMSTNISIYDLMYKMPEKINLDILYSSIGYTLSVLVAWLLIKLLLLVIIPISLLYLIKMILRKICKNKIVREMIAASIGSYIYNKISSYI